MNAAFSMTNDDQGDISTAPAAPRVLDLAELLQVSGGAPSGLQTATIEGGTNIIEFPEPKAPRGGW